MAPFPAIFIGHGSPMNALEDNEFSREWIELGQTIPRPRSILCISAHWTTQETFVTDMDEPRTIHDFYGFPEELNQIQYPAPGDPVLAEEICKHTRNNVRADQRWGLDHGCWSVLKRMYPDADIPVVQLSLNQKLSPEQHMEFAHHIKYLREKEVLILGTGNIVHNLSKIIWSDTAHPWAVTFDETVKEKILQRDFPALCNYNNLCQESRLSVPSEEHYLPMLYVLGVSNPASNIRFFCEKVTMGAISMRSFIVEN